MALTASRALDRLAQRYQDQQIALALRASSGVDRAWSTIVDGVGDGVQRQFAATASRLVGGLQLQSIDLAGAYIGQAASLLDVKAGKHLDAELIQKGLRSGTSLMEVYARPFVTARTILSKGGSYADAISAARSRAVGSADTDAMLAARAGSHEAMQRSAFTMYERVPDGGACPFCILVATKPYYTEDLAAVHTKCHCTPKPMAPGGKPRAELSGEVKVTKTLADGSRKTYTYGPKDVAVSEHGELGPVLHQSGQTFTGPDDF